ncbi:MAG: MFS transporter [Dehalococcoidia bacterium]|nr:MFS transporter [Dehalococcoidia bacterium]MDW8119257.1 MFS transporter [Chloroflexota bacterium]
MRIVTPVKMPRVGRVFHGWWIVGAAFLADFVMAGTGIYAFSVLLRPMAESLQWSLGTLTGALILRSGVAGVLSPFIGPLVDTRHGARILMSLGAVVGGLGLIAISFVQTPLQFYLAFGVVGAISILTSGFLVSSTVVSKWFIRYRGRALAIAAMGISAGGVALIPLTNWLLGMIGWRATWQVLGLISLVVVAPAAFLVVRRRPEDMGLLPDGVSAPPSAVSGEGAHSGREVAWTLRAALRTPALWLVLASTNLGLMGLQGVLVHQIAMLQERGLTRDQAALVGTVLTVFALVTKPPWGLLAERVPVRYLMSIVGWGAALGVGLLLATSGMATGIAYAVVLGTFVSATAPLNNLVWANYFGREFLGTIRGAIGPASMAVNSVAPFAVSLLHDRFSSYTVPLYAIVALYTASAVLILLAVPPKPPFVRGSAGGGAPSAGDGPLAKPAGVPDRPAHKGRGES